MKVFPNFYETAKEARMRLEGTVVCYDGEPHHVFAITDHKSDGIFRAYLMPIRTPVTERKYPDIYHISQESPDRGAIIDQYMNDVKGCQLLRKMLNSPLFNKFRPYPLGMCNIKTRANYIERQPNRKTEQGLIRTMINQTPIDIMPEGKASPMDILHPDFWACVMGLHPTAQECLEALKTPEIQNRSAAFHRNFALVRGPIGTIFLAYKEDVVGSLPNGDFSVLRLGQGFKHVKEAATELRLFETVTQ